MRSCNLPRSNRGHRSESARSAEGFTLVEMLIALVVLVVGLLSAAQMIYVAMSSASLARSKGSAAVVAQDKLEFLADLYNRDKSAADLTDGNHGPETVQVLNPATNVVLNRFRVTWTVSPVVDPRAGWTLHTRHVTVTVTPVNATDGTNLRVGLNKIVTVSMVFSPRNS